MRHIILTIHVPDDSTIDGRRLSGVIRSELITAYLNSLRELDPHVTDDGELLLRAGAADERTIGRIEVFERIRGPLE